MAIQAINHENTNKEKHLLEFGRPTHSMGINLNWYPYFTV